MAYNRSQLREIIYAHLEDYPTLDKLGAAITDAAALTFVCTTFDKYFDGVFVELASGEVVRVNGDPTTTTITVFARGMNGTTAATQLISTINRVNPKFYQWQLNSDINDCLTNRVLKTTYNATAVTTEASTRLYDLPAAIKADRINNVYLYNSDNTKKELIRRYRLLYGTGGSGVDQIEFLDVHTASRKIGIEYLAGFTAFSADNVACDLPNNETAQLIPTYWAAYVRISEKETPRLKKDKGTFSKSGTPYGARTSNAEYWLQKFISACRSAGLHPNVPGGGALTVSYPTIQEY